MTPLAVRLKGAKAPGADPATTKRARAALMAGVEAAAPDAAAEDLATGTAAVRAGGVELGRLAEAGALEGTACAAGCAWCCLIGEDGPVISRAEALHLHAALAPLAGARPGTDWHPRACPSLDPETRACRAYAARPLICRTYVSTSAAACEVNAAGGEAEGAAVLGAQPLYLAALSLARSALKGRAKVATYGLARIARAALEGQDAPTALKASRQPDTRLPQETRRLSPRSAT